MMRKLTFRSQFMIALAVTLLLSIGCTAGTWGISLYFLIKANSFLHPSNYYEQKIPEIIQFAEQNKDKLFSPDFQEELEQVIPLEGFDYQVMDASGQGGGYGWNGERFFNEPGDILRKLNTTEHINGRIIKYYPILGSQHELAGVFVIRYTLGLINSNPKQGGLVLLFVLGNMAAPFIFILLFTIILARKVGKRLEPRITELINGAGRIQNNDLDFTFTEAGGSKELTQLAGAFEEMRGALQQSLTTQWQMEQERRDMVAAIAHDLRTPLTIVRGHVDNLLEGRARQAERLDKYLHTIRKNTDRAVRLLDDMSSISEIDRPDFTLSIRPVDLIAFVQEKTEEYRMICAAKRISFESIIRVADGHNGWFKADVQRLEQMMDNVISNSLRFTPDAAQIKWELDIGPGITKLTVNDSGPGFSEFDLLHMFDKFYQGDPSRSVHKGHAGLGLYIVQALTKKHGGTVTVGNRPEGGAYVQMTIRE
ncbi:cell wall metabolism sensor histidine kinase WalK [Paenibacillus sp. J2TS4]|uniref:sensor histidine kinase n=1 Tax=Paenibacillus sp. J2TS4 TaxID=2807194 RepID=UPI001B169025|nr:HAMP domain-containing sensor histidine kinase [Paenibacillus sp. J2TS4]GIP33805.1 sensor histidine kinase [Paenibacillus sp. J2TS4]